MQTLLEHRGDVKLEHVVVAKDWLIVFQRANGLQAAVAYRLPGVTLRLLPLRPDGCTRPCGGEAPAAPLSGTATLLKPGICNLV